MSVHKVTSGEECIKENILKESMEFNDIMEFWPLNKVMYEELKEEIEEIVPMIGAGITQNIVKDDVEPYLGWAELLKEVASKLGEHNYRNIEKYINNGNYEEAAQEIVNIIGKGGLLTFIKRKYSAEKIDADKLKNSPVAVLPHLFDHLILTTNYDKVIEYAYMKSKQIEILLPTASKRDFVDVIRRKNKSCILYKYHGDIEKGLEDIVLTKDSYDLYYGNKYEKTNEETELVRNLSFCLLAHPILFLGCSLKNDRIMDLLLKNNEVHHFAFVACGANSKEKFDVKQASEEAIRRNAELDEKNIRAIFYPRYDRECVKKLLDELMKYKNQVSNDGLYYQVYTAKEDWIYEFLKKLVDVGNEESVVQNHIVIFGGIFSDIREYEKEYTDGRENRAKTNIDNLNEWLKKNSKAQIFICYDSEEAAEHRAEQTQEDISIEERYNKIKKIRKIPSFFSDNVRDRVYLIPLMYSLTGYSFLLDSELYWNIITHGRSSKGPLLKIMENMGEYGKNEKADKISYMLYALNESKEIIIGKQKMLVEGINLTKKVDPVFEDAKKVNEALNNIDILCELLQKIQSKNI